MKKEDLTVILLRLLGIYCLTMAIPMFSSVGIYLYSMTQNMDQMNYLSALFVSLLPGVGVLVFGIGLLRWAPLLAKWITPGESQETLSLNYQSQDIQAMAFAVVGVIVIVMALPNLAHSIMVFLSATKTSSYPFKTSPLSEYWYRFGGQALRILLGLWLFFGAGGLSRFWHRLRTAGSGS